MQTSGWACLSPVKHAARGRYVAGTGWVWIHTYCVRREEGFLTGGGVAALALMATAVGGCIYASSNHIRIALEAMSRRVCTKFYSADGQIRCLERAELQRMEGLTFVCVVKKTIHFQCHSSPSLSSARMQLLTHLFIHHMARTNLLGGRCSIV